MAKKDVPAVQIEPQSARSRLHSPACASEIQAYGTVVRTLSSARVGRTGPFGNDRAVESVARR